MSSILRNNTTAKDLSLDTDLPPLVSAGRDHGAVIAEPKKNLDASQSLPLQKLESFGSDLSQLRKTQNADLSQERAAQPALNDVEVNSLAAHRNTFLMEQDLSPVVEQSIVDRLVTWMAAMIKAFETKLLNALPRRMQKKTTILAEDNQEEKESEKALQLKKNKLKTQQLDAAKTIRFSSEN